MSTIVAVGSVRYSDVRLRLWDYMQSTHGGRDRCRVFRGKIVPRENHIIPDIPYKTSEDTCAVAFVSTNKDIFI